MPKKSKLIQTGNSGAVAKPKAGVNTRKADAGLIRLRNPTWPIGRCLIEAGFSPATSRSPARNNLTEEQCIAEAWKLEPDPKPGRILRKARVLLEKKLDLGLAHEDDLRGTKYSDMARMVDTVERSYAGTDEAIDTNARTFAQRMKWLQDVVAELSRRENLIDSAVDRAVTVDAVVIDAEDPGASEN